jgi:glycosyltransferase involved in cell wall biosynthesis
MKILFIERSPTTTVSIEKVFREVAKELVIERFEVEFQQMPFDNSFLGIIKNLYFFKAKEADIYHITGHIHYIGLRIPIAKTLLTIHDMRILHDRKGIRRWIIKKLFFDLPVRRLKYITAISTTTRAEIVEKTGCLLEKITVIENPAFRPKIKSVKKEFNIKCPTILQVGTAFHKNLQNLVKSLEGLDCVLRIVGQIDESFSQKNRGVKIENLVNLNEIEMEDEYSNADIVSFCSLYEGFGLPIIEGQIFGKPVITSRLSPMKDVAGEGASLVNPENPTEIREAINRIIADAEYRNSLVEKGFENIKRFDPVKIASQYAQIYKQILAGSDNKFGK